MKKIMKKINNNIYKVLLVEDNCLFAQTLEDFLEENGFSIVCACNGDVALEKCYREQFDLYLLDINMPCLNGLSLLEVLRGNGDMTPAIFITSSQNKEDLRQGYMVGADDYIRKPLDLEELLFKIQVSLRRKISTVKEICLSNDYIYCPSGRRVYSRANMEDMNLPPKVLRLLELFLENEGRLLSKEIIVDTLWASSEDMSEGALRVYISKIQKLFPNSLKNVKGVGYCFENVTVS